MTRPTHLTVVALVLAIGPGCAARGIPAYSLARYARANPGEQVRLVGAGAAGYMRETEAANPGPKAELLVAPIAETGGTYRLDDLYNVHFTVGPGLLTVEGQFRFGTREVAIGVLHGAGAGVSAIDTDPQLQINLIGGVFVQLALDSQHSVMVAGRYIFDDIYGGALSGENGLHWITGGIGWVGQMFSFFGLGAEIHGGIVAPVNGNPALWFILPTLTLNAAF